MAAAFIPVNQSSAKGRKLVRFAELLRECFALADECRDTMAEMTDLLDVSLVEQQYGLPTGRGQAAIDLVTNARATLRGAATKLLIDRIG